MDGLQNLVLLLLIGSTLALQPAIIERLKPQGIKFTIKDDGYRLVGVHFNINSPLAGVAGGRYNYDVNTKTGNNWVFESTSIPVHPGDTINYWINSIDARTNQGQSLTDISVTLQDATTTTTTQAPQTPAPITQAPITPPVTHAPQAQTQAPQVQTQAPINVHSSVTPGFSGGSGTGSSTSSSAGPKTSGTGGSAAGTGTATGTQQQQVVCKGSTAVQCTSYPCLVFEDNFDFINFDVWEHEITASGGGNWEFQYYTNNRSNSYTHDGVLYIKPTLTADKYGEPFLHSGTLELYGNNPGDACTGPQFWGCSRQGAGGNIVNPIQSARLRSSKGFNFKYGRVEIEAKMPKGDWIWPAIWMLPKHNAYGQWPASGEIDIVESRGNRNYMDDKGGPQGVNHMGSTLHFGPDSWHNAYEKAHAENPYLTNPSPQQAVSFIGPIQPITVSGNLADSWHRYGLEWDENSIKLFLDGAQVLTVTPDSAGFWKKGELEKTHMENPWRYASKMAPFDQEFYFVLNVAVGGTAFFPDKFRNTPAAKPWNDKSQHAAGDFYAQKNVWYPTWNPNTNNGEDAAMKINYIIVWKLKP